MSREISRNSLTEEELKVFTEKLNVYQEPSKFGFATALKCICLFDSDEKNVYIPYAYGSKYPRPSRDQFPDQEIECIATLRPGQKIVKNEAITHLNKYGSTIISAYCGFGKSLTAIYIACKIKMKTLIVCHRIVLMNQWKKAIEMFCPSASVEIITPKTKSLKDCDFFIINATNVSKHSRQFYKEIGFVICDEAHLLMAEKMCMCMKYLTPRYILGLSATPYRNDGLDVLLDMYFGKRKIIRELFREHIVYRVDTGIKPDVKLNKMGKIDWGSVIESQAENEERNRMIVKIVQKFPDRVFLILCKRVNQANYLYNLLQEVGEDVTSLIGSQQEYEKTSRVLVGTAQKAGVGFDHPRLDSLILASDIEQYFVQYLGRVFRREDVKPLIFDILDNHGVLLKHFRTRNAVYVKHGGIVQKFDKTTLD